MRASWLSRDERWQIVSVDGREPTDKEIEAFLKEKSHDHSGGGDRRINAMVEKDSVHLIEESKEFWLFGFTPEEHQAVMDSVDATKRRSLATANSSTSQISKR
ncbi:MAG: hypothetical protein ACR2RD_05675 [Woeseiaceae bacterium]